MAGLVDLARVALDGSSPEIHDVIRGDGSFEAAINGINNLVKAGIPVTIDHTLSKLSLTDTKNMQSLAKSLDAELIIGCYRLLGRGKMAKELMMLPHASLACTSNDDVSSALHEGFGGTGDDTPPSIPAPFTVRDRCNAVTAKVSISCHGKAYPCEFLRGPEFEIGNIVEAGSLSELLSHKNSVVKTVLSRTVDAVPGCKNCDVRYFCDGLCMAESYAHSGSIWHKDPYCVVKKSELNRQVWADKDGI
jgi:radical SAM protein with 4Fe4S-binding SPASM domain